MTRDYTPIVRGILSAAASALNEAQRAAGRVQLTSGQLPAWDNCCDGQLDLRTIEVYPSMGEGSPFPQFDSGQRGARPGPCTIHGLAVHLGLGIMRCAAVVDNQGNAPAPEVISAEAEVMLADMATLLDVIVCTVPDIRGVQAVKLDRWQPQGNNGGCVGGEWGFYIAVDPCLCKPLPPED